jgi:hypothetical protein
MLGLMACDDYEPDYTPERGDLGTGKFIYQCLGESDATCAVTERYPQAIAVNARFGMRFATYDGVQPVVIAGAPSFTQTVVGGFKALRAGQLAMLAVNGNREVIDIKHFRSAEIAEVRVKQGDALPQEEIDLVPGEPIELSAVPFDFIGVELAGALDYAWTSGDPTLVAVETLSDLSRIRIRALREGETTLNVMVGGQVHALVVRASGEAPPEPDAGGDAGEDGGVPDEEDAGEDSGVEQDGGQS